MLPMCCGERRWPSSVTQLLRLSTVLRCSRFNDGWREMPGGGMNHRTTSITHARNTCYRVPPSANGRTFSMFDESTIDGPVRTDCPPPRSLPLVLYNHNESTAS